MANSGTGKMDFLTKRGYHTFEPIDAGGQGNVYKTQKGDRLYAIKVLPVEVKNNAEGKVDTDLVRELNILRQLRHPNCVRMEDAFRTKSKVYIVMPYLCGGTIGTVVKKYGPLCEWNCKIWFPPIAMAVRYLHRNKVAHRDLKLDNVLLDEYQNPYVADYGFSRFADRTNPGKLCDTFCGTRSFNPPQILLHIPYNPFKGDIWCLGVMFFIMLNKEYPFDKADEDDHMYAKMIAKNYHLTKKVDAKVSGAAKDLIAITMEPDEVKRVDIETLCKHPWMPAIYDEAKQIIEQMHLAHGEQQAAAAAAAKKSQSDEEE